MLTCVFGDEPLPAFDGVSLEIIEEGKDGSKVLYPVASAILLRAVLLEHMLDILICWHWPGPGKKPMGLLPRVLPL